MAQDEPEVAEANAKAKRRTLMDRGLVALAMLVFIVYAALQLGWMVRVFL